MYPFISWYRTHDFYGVCAYAILTFRDKTVYGTVELVENKEDYNAFAVTFDAKIVQKIIKVKEWLKSVKQRRRYSPDCDFLQEWYERKKQRARASLYSPKAAMKLPGIDARAMRHYDQRKNSAALEEEAPMFTRACRQAANFGFRTIGDFKA